MTRTAIAIATAAIAAATLFTSAAQACISCEYTPEVARSSSSGGGEARSYSRRSYSATIERRERTSKRRTADRERAKSVKSAKSEKSDEPRSKRSVASTEKRVEPTTSAETKTTEKKVETAAAFPAVNENSTITTATLQPASDTPSSSKPVTADATTVKAEVGCKKFFPTVGLTLSVPCE